MMIILLFFFLLAAALFALAVFPLWMVVDCARSKALPKASKALWLVSIVMAWPFGSLAYASFASQKRFLVKLSNMIIASLIVMSLLFSAGIYYFRSALLPETVARYQKAELKDLSPDKQQTIKSDLVTLQNEMQANAFFSEKSLVALQLFELFQSIAFNRKAAASEYEDWLSQASVRATLREENLPAYIGALNRKTIQNILASAK